MNPSRLLICSLPKSGTHLLSSFLIDKFKLTQPINFIHHSIETNSYRISLERNNFGGNRDEWLNFAPNLPYAYYTSHEFTDNELLLSFIREGEFALSHFSRRNIPFILDASFHYVILLRRIESIISSAFNTEHKIVREKPNLINGTYSDINFINPSKEDFHSFINLFLKEIIPLALDFIYWRYSVNSYFLWFDDLLTSEQAKNDLAIHVGKILCLNPTIQKPEPLSPQCNSPTYIDDKFKILSPDIVSDLIVKNEIISELNQVFFSLTHPKDG
jgi:hypothetical protein